MDADLEIKSLIWPPPKNELERVTISDAVEAVKGASDLRSEALEILAMYSLQEPDTPGLWPRDRAEEALRVLAGS